ncbi:MAG: ABC transporter ATP-binding protein [Salinibacterium sp.]|nr:ABC transporter ATP-binding protein [Salinibacterium sp.]
MVENVPVERLSGANLRVGYDQRAILQDLSIVIPDDAFTVIVGPNACGKSTLLRTLARVLKPSGGTVLLDGNDIAKSPSKEVARSIGLLPQSSMSPEGITVVDLVSRGRYPHQSFLKQWSVADEQAVAAAMDATHVTDLATRHVDELSGGQRQRVWVAMALAQQTSILLLDEPTTFLDIAHQVELLDLFDRLNREHGRSLIAVLHDLNQAARYATHLIVMKDGGIVAQGAPDDVVTAELVEQVFGLRARIIEDPESGSPLVIPLMTR